MDEIDIRQVLTLIPELSHIPLEGIQYSYDYDKEVDVLYITFGEPRSADDSILTDDVIIRYKGHEVIGITILHFNQREWEAAHEVEAAQPVG